MVLGDTDGRGYGQVHQKGLTKKDLKTVVAKNIRKYRLDRDLTQAGLAIRSGVDVRYINRAENMPQNICLDHLNRLAKALNVPAYVLLINTNMKSAKDLIASNGAME